MTADGIKRTGAAQRPSVSARRRQSIIYSLPAWAEKGGIYMGLDMYIKRIRKPEWRDEFGLTVPSNVYDEISLSGENLIRLTEDKIGIPGNSGLRDFAIPVRVMQSYIDTDRIAEVFTKGVPVTLGGMEMKNGVTVFRFYPVHPVGRTRTVHAVELDSNAVERDYRRIQLETQYVFQEENASYWREAGLVQDVIHSALHRSLGLEVDNLVYYRLKKDAARAVLNAVPDAFSWTESDENGETGLFYKEWY